MVLESIWQIWQHSFSDCCDIPSFFCPQELYQVKSSKKDGELKSLQNTVEKLQEENIRIRMEYEISANEKPGI